MKYPHYTRFLVLGPKFYIRKETNDIEWLVITVACLKLSYRIPYQDFNEHHVNRFLLRNGFHYAPSTIRSALNSLCSEGLCTKVICSWDRRIKNYRFNESLKLHNIFKNSFMF